MFQLHPTVISMGSADEWADFDDEFADEPPELGGDEPAGELPEPVGGASTGEFDVGSVDAPDESGDELGDESGSAHATPGVFATAIPMPSATAKAPTRPT